MRVIVGRADERLHLGALEQAVDIVIVPHEIDRKFLRRLLLPEFCRDGLELLDEGVARVIASDGLYPVVDDRHFVGCIIIEPRADILFVIRGHVIETEFQQDARLKPGSLAQRAPAIRIIVIGKTMSPSTMRRGGPLGLKPLFEM